MKKETILLSNLNCPTCASDVEKAFKNTAGVKEVNVIFAAGMLKLEYDEAKLEDEQIKKTLGSFGVKIASRM